MNTATHTKRTWVAELKHRYFWGMPHTETDCVAFRQAINGRVAAVAQGQFAAVQAVEAAVDRVSSRSMGLLLANTLFVMMSLLLAWKAGNEQGATFLQLSRWGLVLAMASGFVLVTNLRLVWASDAALHYGDPEAAYRFNMGIYKGRAWRYSTALVLTFAAYGCAVVSLTQMR